MAIAPADTANNAPARPGAHPHLADDVSAHVHDYVIDALHRRWPKQS